MTRKKQAAFFFVLGLTGFLILSAASFGQEKPAGAFFKEQGSALLKEFTDFLSIPNVASDQAGIRRTAEAAAALLRRRGVEARLLEGEGCPPLVFGELPGRNANRTIIFYAHYDGQPVDPSQWVDGPWKPVLRDGRLEDGGRAIDPSAVTFDGRHDYRLYGRSTSDDKAPILALAAALDLLKAEGRPLSINVKFLFEGEEEAGSPHLPALLQKYKDLLKADGLFICDGPTDQTGRMAVDFGVRGVLGLELTVYGPNHPLHSGHYGNWAPNPIAILANLLASMRDNDGQVLIPAFYDGVRPLTDLDLDAIEELPDNDARLRHEYGLAWTEGDDARLAERILLPALNFRGISGGEVGARAANAIPSEARASIDFRLVPDQEPEAVRTLVEDHIHEQGFFVLDHDPNPADRLTHPWMIKLDWEAGYPPYRLPLDHPFGLAAVKALTEGLGEAPLRWPSLGGSAPLMMFADALGLPVLGLPIANYDNNQHGPNENIRLKNLWDGISIFAAVLGRLGGAW